MAWHLFAMFKKKQEPSQSNRKLTQTAPVSKESTATKQVEDSAAHISDIPQSTGAAKSEMSVSTNESMSSDANLSTAKAAQADDINASQTVNGQLVTTGQSRDIAKETDLHVLVDQRTQAEQEMKKTYQMLVDQQDKLKEYLRQENRVLNQKIQTGVKTISDTQAHQREQEQQIKVLKEQISAVTAEQKKLDNRINEFRKQSDALTDGIKEFEKKRTEVSTQLSRLKTKIQQRDAEAKEKVKSLKEGSAADVDSFFVEVERIKNEIHQGELEKEQLQQQAQTLQEQQADFAKREDSLRSEKKNMAQKVSKFQTQKRDLDNQLFDDNQTAAQKRRMIETLETKLAHDASQIDRVQKNVQEWQTGNASVQMKLQQLTNSQVQIFNPAAATVMALLKDLAVTDDKTVLNMLLGYYQYYSERNIAITVVTLAFNEDLAQILADFKKKLKIHGHVGMLNLYDDLLDRHANVVPKDVTPYIDPNWKKDTSQVDDKIDRYLDSEGKVAQEVIYRKDSDKIWMIDHYRNGELIMRDVYDKVGYLVVSQTVSEADHTNVASEVFYNTYGRATLTKHYRADGTIEDIQIVDDTGMLQHVFRSEDDLQVWWIKEKMRESKQSQLMVDINYPSFAAVASSQEADYAVLPVISQISTTEIREKFEKANLVQSIIVNDERVVSEIQQIFGHRYAVTVIPPVDLEAEKFNVLLPGKQNVGGRGDVK